MAASLPHFLSFLLRQFNGSVKLLRKSQLHAACKLLSSQRNSNMQENLIFSQLIGKPREQACRCIELEKRTTFICVCDLMEFAHILLEPALDLQLKLQDSLGGSKLWRTLTGLRAEREQLLYEIIYSDENFKNKTNVFSFVCGKAHCDLEGLVSLSANLHLTQKFRRKRQVGKHQIRLSATKDKAEFPMHITLRDSAGYEIHLKDQIMRSQEMKTATGRQYNLNDFDIIFPEIPQIDLGWCFEDKLLDLYPSSATTKSESTKGYQELLRLQRSKASSEFTHFIALYAEYSELKTNLIIDNDTTREEILPIASLKSKIKSTADSIVMNIMEALSAQEQFCLQGNESHKGLYGYLADACSGFFLSTDGRRYRKKALKIMKSIDSSDESIPLSEREAIVERSFFDHRFAFLSKRVIEKFEQRFEESREACNRFYRTLNLEYITLLLSSKQIEKHLLYQWTRSLDNTDHNSVFHCFALKLTTDYLPNSKDNTGCFCLNNVDDICENDGCSYYKDESNSSPQITSQLMFCAECNKEYCEECDFVLHAKGNVWDRSNHQREVVNSDIRQWRTSIGIILSSLQNKSGSAAQELRKIFTVVCENPVEIIRREKFLNNDIDQLAT